MEEWEERLAALEVRLREWNVRYEEELAKVCKQRGIRGFLRRPGPDALRAAADEAQRLAGTEVLSDFAVLADQLCILYVKSLPQDRAKIRARVGSAENVFGLFWSYVEQGPERVLRGPAAEESFHRALVALAIDDLRAEIGQVDEVLGRLLVAAAGAGIDWKPQLVAVARIANPGMGGGGGCMREYLEDFEGSAYFRGHVAERLREAARGSLSARSSA
jgi:hypothetical protein